MPGGDRTGPMGAGPMTGRAAGYCAGFPVPGFMNPGFGGAWFGRRWYGRGRGGGGFGGGGRGRRNWFYATGLTGWQRATMGWPAWGASYGPVPPVSPAPPATAENEAELLRRQAEYLAGALEQIRKRLDQLGKTPAGKEG